MSQQSQSQRALELIIAEHGAEFSKYKVEAKDIILDAKKGNHLKVQKVFLFSFPSQATRKPMFRALCSVLGIWPDDIHILELVE